MAVHRNNSTEYFQTHLFYKNLSFAYEIYHLFFKLGQNIGDLTNIFYENIEV